jgi:Histidine kinase-, DNA gyrase B-, and HSP90-like ATPase
MPSHDAALRQVVPLTADPPNGRVALRYVARAGLLPELSRQTYDSFAKALREAILNSSDAGASRVDVDLSRIESHAELTVSDDGDGMSTKEFCEQFMSLGGSSKFGDGSRFGRIGIGSLALLQYAEGAIIETKRAGTAIATRARLQHPWVLGRDQRRGHLAELAAGFAEEFEHPGPQGDHFTRIRLEGLNSDVWSVGQDPTAFYKLVEDLRRLLPLPWNDGRLVKALQATSPKMVATLRQHIADWATPVYVHGSWERDIQLVRRAFGEDQAGVEDWSGPPVPILKTISVNDDAGRRKLTIAGYLLNQKRAQANWAGLTARVQNVAVEQHTFFDVTADPGFRKYITGEVWILGDVDRERLINIDRSSFNRECADYHAVQRFMSRAIVEFKSESVQRPQRQKVTVRRILEDHVRALRAIATITEHAAVVLEEAGAKALPSSEPSRGRLANRRGIVEILKAANADVAIDDARAPDDLSFEIELSDDGERIEATIGQALAEPRVRVGDIDYRVTSASATAEDPPVLIRNRPREIIFNTTHSAHLTGDRQTKYQLSLALELAYLLEATDPAGVYHRMLSFIEAL